MRTKVSAFNLTQGMKQTPSRTSEGGSCYLWYRPIGKSVLASEWQITWVLVQFNRSHLIPLAWTPAHLAGARFRPMCVRSNRVFQTALRAWARINHRWNPPQDTSFYLAQQVPHRRLPTSKPLYPRASPAASSRFSSQPRAAFAVLRTRRRVAAAHRDWPSIQLNTG